MGRTLGRSSRPLAGAWKDVAPGSWQRAAVRAVLVGACLVAVACALPGIGVFRGHIGAHVFQDYGDRVLGGEVPYRDFSLEYPPGSLPAVVIPSLGPAAEYDAWFSAFEVAAWLACIVAVSVALARAGLPDRRIYAAVGVVALAPLGLGQTAIHSFDLYAAAFTVGGLAAVLHRRDRLGLALLGIGAATKIFPVVLVPLACLHIARRASWRQARSAFTACVVAVVVVAGPFVAIAPGGVRFSVERQLDRPLQIESIGSSALLVIHALDGYTPGVAFGSGSTNLVGSVPDHVAQAQTVIQVLLWILVVVLFARSGRGRADLVAAAAAAMAVWMTFGKVLSPQYLLWLLPLLALCWGWRQVWIAAPAALIAALGLTQAVYPGRYEALTRLESAPIVLLAARNLLLLALAAVLVVRAAATPRRELARSVGEPD